MKNEQLYHKYDGKFIIILLKYFTKNRGLGMACLILF